MKGYRSDFDLLIIVNNRKLCDFAECWHKAADRLIRNKAIETPVNFIVHSRREVDAYLKEGQYFFSDIRKEGIALYELDDEPLAGPGVLTPEDRPRIAQEHFHQRLAEAHIFIRTSNFQRDQAQGKDRDWISIAAFSLHQSLEQAYSGGLLTLKEYAPPSHNVKFLRSLGEEQRRIKS